MTWKWKPIKCPFCFMRDVHYRENTSLNIFIELDEIAFYFLIGRAESQYVISFKMEIFFGCLQADKGLRRQAWRRHFFFHLARIVRWGKHLQASHAISPVSVGVSNERWNSAAKYVHVINYCAFAIWLPWTRVLFPWLRYAGTVIEFRK